MSKIQYGVRTTNFYPPSMTIPNSLDEAAGNVSSSLAQMRMQDPTSKNGTLPAMWWLGIVIVLVGIRVAYEMS